MAITSVYKEMRGVVSLRDMDYDDLCEKVEQFEFYMKLSGSYLYYAFVLHNADVDEKGKEETPHIQFYCRQAAVKRVKTVCNEIADALGLTSLAVSIRKGNNKDLGIRYLLHADDQQKFQYPKDQLHHNYPQDYIDLLFSEEWENDDGKMDFSKVYDIVVESEGSNTYIIEKLGLDVYMHYRWAIVDLKKELYGEVMHRYRKAAVEKKGAVN